LGGQRPDDRCHQGIEGVGPNAPLVKAQIYPNQNLAAVRERAKSAGINVSDGGRFPKTVLDQYEAAHSD